MVVIGVEVTFKKVVWQCETSFGSEEDRSTVLRRRVTGWFVGWKEPSVNMAFLSDEARLAWAWNRLGRMSLSFPTTEKHGKLSSTSTLHEECEV